MNKLEHLWIFGRYSGTLRLIESLKLDEDGKSMKKIQERRSFIGISYWRTIYQDNDLNKAIGMYKLLIAGHPDYMNKDLKNNG